MKIDIGIVIGSAEYDAEIEVEVEEGAVLHDATLWLGKEQSNIRLPEKIIRAIEHALAIEEAERLISSVEED